MSKDWTGNTHSVVGCLGARNETKTPREEHDFYASPPEAAEWLLKIETLTDRIWECACGEGHLGKVLERAGKDVLATDLIDRGYGHGGVDFLKCECRFDGDIVTNPPYKYALEFMKKAIELAEDGRKVCFFLKLQYLEGKARRKFFEENPPARVWVSSSRLSCGRNGDFHGSMMAHAWFVWIKGYRGKTELGWFN